MLHTTLPPPKKGKLEVYKCIKYLIFLHQIGKEYEATCLSTGKWSPNYTCKREFCLKNKSAWLNDKVCLSVAFIWFCALHIANPILAVNCGPPDIPKGGILQVVGSEMMRTNYKDRIQFHCISKYYTLKGDGKYKTLSIRLNSKANCKNIHFFFKKKKRVTFQSDSFRFLHLRCKR